MARFLVQHDYGMASLYWWIEAPSADDILEAFAEVRVVPDPDEDEFATTPWIVLGQSTYPPGLADLHEQRGGQVDRPGYRALAGRDPVYLRRTDPDFPGITYLTEHDGEGYRTRQVMIDAGEDIAERSGPEDWLLDPPEDLWDPDLAECEVSREEFESAWSRARPQP